MRETTGETDDIYEIVSAPTNPPTSTSEQSPANTVGGAAATASADDSL